MYRYLTATIIVMLIFAGVVQCYDPIYRWTTTASHTTLNSSGVTFTPPFQCRILSVHTGYTAAQTSTMYYTFDSAQGTTYDARMVASTLTAATSECQYFADNPVILMMHTAQGVTTTPDKLKISSVGADSATAYITVFYRREEN